MTVQFWLLWTLSAIAMAQVQIHYIAYMCVINVIWYLCYNVLKISLNFSEPLDPNSVKPMPFQDRVSFSWSGGKAVAAAAPSKPVVPQIPKVGTSNNKKGNPAKRPASTSPKYSYSVRGGPFALSSPARVNPALTSPKMSSVRCPPRNNTNGFILLDSESD